MATLLGMALIGIFILMIIGVVSNASPAGIQNIEDQIFLFNCPFPINGGTATNLNIQGLTANYTLVRDNSSSDYHLTVFNCSIQGSHLKDVNTTVFTTANNWFNVGLAYLGYISQSIFAIGAKIQALFTLFAFILTPANFSILGYTLSDVGGAGLIIVVGVYLVSYVMIAFWLWSSIIGVIRG